MKGTVRSSYKSQNLNYEHIFQVICFLVNPKKIVEFGILDGFSLHCFEKYTSKDCKILALDIFEDFLGNHADEIKIKKMFQNNQKIKIEKGDFYQCHTQIEDNSIDIIHIDIANDGNTYKFALDKYLPKLSENGLMLLEGGSEERDNVYWMEKYNKTKINDILGEFNLKQFCVIQPHPSLTIFKKRL